MIFLTGKTEADDETKGFEVGAVDYIHKPFSPAVVKARVHTHLVLREAREQLARQLLSINSELEMAREIQMSILPHEIPQIKGLEIAARYLPMTSVAGDFYDFIVVDEKHLGILVADVSGHGLPAALIASMLKAALSAQSAHACDPARVLAGLNQSLCGKFKHHFATAAYVFVDMEKNSMQLRCRGTSAAAAVARVNGERLGSAGKWPTTRPTPRDDLLRRGGTGGTGRQGPPLHRRNPGDYEPVGAGIWRRSVQRVSGIQP